MERSVRGNLLLANIVMGQRENAPYASRRFQMSNGMGRTGEAEAVVASEAKTSGGTETQARISIPSWVCLIRGHLRSESMLDPP